jgi:putative redox protein
MTPSSTREATAPRIRTIRLESRSVDGMRNVARVRQFAVVSDEPRPMGGDDSGPTPMEYVLAGLASCLTVTARLVADEMGLRLGTVTVALEGDLDVRGLFGQADVRPDFQAVRGTITVGEPLRPDDLDRLRERVLRRSPAYQLFRAAGADLEILWTAARGDYAGAP